MMSVMPVVMLDGGRCGDRGNAVCPGAGAATGADACAKAVSEKRPAKGGNNDLPVHRRYFLK
jgi:hypothetical protein